MKKVVLYVAASLDGFIARPDGALDWLPVLEPGGEDYGYADFLAGVEVLLMGRKTHEKVRETGPWPYHGRRCYVFSGTLAGGRDGDVEFLDCDVAAFVRELKAEPGEGVIWLVGGGEIVAACLGGDVVDEIVLTTVPVLLGEGVRLFPEVGWTTPLRREAVRVFDDGLVQQCFSVTGVPALAGRE